MAIVPIVWGAFKSLSFSTSCGGWLHYKLPGSLRREWEAASRTRFGVIDGVLSPCLTPYFGRGGSSRR